MAGKPAKTAAKKAAPKSAPKTAAKKAAPAAAPAAVPPAPIVMPAPTTAPSMGGKDPMYPIVDRNPWGIIALILGIIGLGGIGTIIAGVISKRHTGRDVVIGIIQIIIPILGNIWGLIWGILIFVKGNK